MLQIHTANINNRDPDRLDVTRQSGGTRGWPFAPSWGILRPVLDARKHAKALLVKARRRPEHRILYELLALAAVDSARAVFAPLFYQEMVVSQGVYKSAWGAVLDLPRVVLVCYCKDPMHCHRTRLARDVFPALGAVCCGELDVQVATRALKSTESYSLKLVSFWSRV